MRRLTFLLLLAACGNDHKANIDGAVDTPEGIDAPGIDAAQMLDCMSYCTTITGACTAANLQYSDMATCVASCAHFPVGMVADMGGDTLGGRTYHANAAKTDPGTHCVHAGPGGGGVCGMPCMGFCDLVVAECPAQWTMSTCANQCGALAQTPPYT